MAEGIHFFASVAGLLTGAYILLAKKGTKLHLKIGYVFCVALLLVNASALFIHDFNDGAASVFHYLIPVSLLFLAYGMLPMLRKKPAPKKTQQTHYRDEWCRLRPVGGWSYRIFCPRVIRGLVKRRIDHVIISDFGSFCHSHNHQYHG